VFLTELELGSALKTFCIFREHYMMGRLNRSYEELLCLSMRIFMHRFSETTFVIMKFCFVLKIQQNSVLCSREISLKRPRIVTRTFTRTFLESSREQRTKFAHFACVTFAQYCNFLCIFLMSVWKPFLLLFYGL